MVFEIKKYFKIADCENFQEKLYDALKKEYTNAVVSKTETKIQLNPITKPGLFYNSFEPNIICEFLDSDSALFVKFRLNRKIQILCCLLWMVSIILGIISMFIDGDIFFTVVVYSSFIFISYIFAFLGLLVFSGKYMRYIKNVLDIHGVGSMIDEE